MKLTSPHLKCLTTDNGPLLQFRHVFLKKIHDTRNMMSNETWLCRVTVQLPIYAIVIRHPGQHTWSIYEVDNLTKHTLSLTTASIAFLADTYDICKWIPESTFRSNITQRTAVTAVSLCASMTNINTCCKHGKLTCSAFNLKISK